MNDTSNVIRPPVNIPRRAVNYTHNGGGNGGGEKGNGSSEDFRKHRKLLLFIGDMIQVIDPKSHLQGKYGLVEEIHTRNPQYNLIIKIGSIRNPLKFSQVRFCARISPTSNNGLKNNGTKFEEDNGVETKVEDYIDRVEDIKKVEEDEEIDNRGNREGSNLITTTRINFNA